MAVIAAGALAAPANALAVDYVSLFVSPSRLGVVADWRLTATVPAPEFLGGTETLGVTLTRKFRNGRAEEIHALRATMPAVSVAFDGRRGRWNVRNRLGPVLTLNMSIVAMGAARPLAEYRGCTGAFAQVPVALRGTFVLRTATAFFGEIRRVRLRGVVIFNRAGPVDCTRAAPPACSPLTTLSVSDAGSGVTVSPDAGGWVSFQVREQLGVSPSAPAWYHVMLVSGVSSLSGELPAIDVGFPAGFPVQGIGRFAARETSESSNGPCSATTTSGVFTGAFHATFAGWGRRTLEFVDATGASYRVNR